MTNYKRTKTNYRKIWSNHFGPIPKDEQGRSYEIHHKDGDNSNNDIDNLQCISIQEHYDIHYSKGEFGSCLKISKRMDMTHEKLSELATKINLKRVADGTHPFLNKKMQKNNALKRVNNGTHHFLDKKAQKERAKIRTLKGKNPFSNREISVKNNKKRLNEKTHNFLGDDMNKNMLINGNHPSQKILKCPHCGFETGSGNAKRWHFDNCKHK